MICVNLLQNQCQDPDSNWGHLHFQCSALPTELSRRRSRHPSKIVEILSKGWADVKFAVNLSVGVVVSRWMPQSSKLVAGCAEQAAVGSTPIHSRLKHLIESSCAYSPHCSPILARKSRRHGIVYADAGPAPGTGGSPGRCFYALGHRDDPSIHNANCRRGVCVYTGVRWANAAPPPFFSVHSASHDSTGILWLF